MKIKVYSDSGKIIGSYETNVENNRHFNDGGSICVELGGFDGENINDVRISRQLLNGLSVPQERKDGLKPIKWPTLQEHIANMKNKEPEEKPTLMDFVEKNYDIYEVNRCPNKAAAILEIVSKYLEEEKNDR